MRVDGKGGGGSRGYDDRGARAFILLMVDDRSINHLDREVGHWMESDTLHVPIDERERGDRSDGLMPA